MPDHLIKHHQNCVCRSQILSMLGSDYHTTLTEKDGIYTDVDKITAVLLMDKKVVVQHTVWHSAYQVSFFWYVPFGHAIHILSSVLYT